MSKTSLNAVSVLLLLSGCATTTVPDSTTTTSAAPPSGQLSGSYNDAFSKAPDSNSKTVSHDAESKQSRAELAALERLTIDEALQIAEANRPELAALRHRIGMAEGDAKQADLWPNPTIAVGLEGYTPNHDNPPPDLSTLENLATLSNRTRSRASTVYDVLFPDSPNPIPTYEFWFPSIPDSRKPDQLQQIVSVAQPLPIWGTRRLARKARLLEMERWRREYERAKLELHSEVRKAFDAVVFQQKRHATTVDLEKTLTEILDVTRARLNAGDIAEVELIKGEADYERFSLEMESARTELSQAKARLARALGNPDLAIESCEGAVATELPDLPEAKLAELRKDHPQVQVWEAIEDTADAKVAVAESRRWPVPTLGIGYRHYEATDQDTFDLSLEFELPLFDRKQGDILRAQEEANFDAATNEAERNNIEATLGQTIAAFTGHKRRAQAFQQRILPRMEESLSIARTSFEAGDTSMLEVLDAYRSLAEARLAHHRELFEARTAFHDLSYLLAGDEQP